MTLVAESWIPSRYMQLEVKQPIRVVYFAISRIMYSIGPGASRPRSQRSQVYTSGVSIHVILPYKFFHWVAFRLSEYEVHSWRMLRQYGSEPVNSFFVSLR